MGAGRPARSLGTPPGCRPSKTQEFRGFILPRFLFTLSAKLDSLPRVWNFEVNFKNLAFVSLSAPGGLTSGWQVYKTRHLSACQPQALPDPLKTWFFDSLILWFFGLTRGPSKLTMCPTLTCQPKESKNQKESKESKNQTCQSSYFFRKSKKADKCRVL